MIIHRPHMPVLQSQSRSRRPHRNVFLSLVFLALVFSSCSGPGPQDGLQPDKDGYVLVWKDEFSGSSLDPSKWDIQLGTGSDYGLVGWGNNESQYYTGRPDNLYLENGYLVIEAKKESYQGMPYTSARIRTKGLASWTYGKFEMRAMLPKSQGLWPAFWMLPEDNAYGSWPASGEIDIMELVGHTPHIVYGTAHFGNNFQDKGYITGQTERGSGDFSDTFHTYQVEWLPDTIRWSLDGAQYHEITREDLGDYRWPFDRRFHLLLNVAVGGNWPGYPDQSTILPQRMIVDYVNVYQKVR